MMRYKQRVGEEPYVGKACARLTRRTLAKLDLLAKKARMTRNGFFELLAKAMIDDAVEENEGNAKQ